MHSVEDGLRFWEIKTAKFQAANLMKHKHVRLLALGPQSIRAVAREMAGGARAPVFFPKKWKQTCIKCGK